METIPMKRPGDPREMALGVAFLSSSAASYITGHTLVIDGGWTSSYGKYANGSAFIKQNLDEFATAARRTGSKEKELPVPKGTVFSMWKLVGW